MTIHRIGLSLCVGLLVCGFAVAENGAPALTLHIEAQPVRAALQQFGEQTGLQVLMRLGKGAEDVRVTALSGEFTAAEALDRMLSQTGLTYEFVNDRTVRITSAASDG